MSAGMGDARPAPRPGKGAIRFADAHTMTTPCADEADIRTIVCGQSHATSLIQALTAAEIDGAPSPGPDIALRLGIGGLPALLTAPGDAVPPQTAALARDRHLAIVWKGNQHNGDFLFAPEPMLDFVASADPAAPIDDTAILVPEAAIREHYQPSIEPLEKLLAAVGSQPGCRRFVLGTPAPLYDAELLRGRLVKFRDKLHAGNAARVRLVGDDVAQIPIMPAAIRRKFWLVLQDLLAEAAARQGAEFVPAPAASLDAHGCLDARYSIGDISHTTVAYGALLLQELARHLADSGDA